MFSPLLDGHGLLWLYHLQTQFLWPDKIRSLSGQSSRGFSIGFSLKCWSRHIKPIRGWLWMVPTMLCTACAVSWLLYRHKCRLLSFCKICQMHGTASPAGLTRCICQGRRNMLAEKVCGLSSPVSILVRHWPSNREICEAKGEHPMDVAGRQLAAVVDFLCKYMQSRYVFVY